MENNNLFLKHHSQIIHTRLSWVPEIDEQRTCCEKENLKFCDILSNDFLTILLGGRLLETENKRILCQISGLKSGRCHTRVFETVFDGKTMYLHNNYCIKQLS